MFHQFDMDFNLLRAGIQGKLEGQGTGLGAFGSWNDITPASDMLGW
jgi:hypothetical protein